MGNGSLSIYCPILQASNAVLHTVATVTFLNLPCVEPIISNVARSSAFSLSGSTANLPNNLLIHRVRREINVPRPRDRALVYKRAFEK